jgi:hypothetical protein
MSKHHALILAALALLASGPSSRAQQPSGAEKPSDILAAQIRLQGFACDKPLGATRDAKRSKPDHAVWVVKCGNATYRLSRAPDMAAKVEPLR